MKKNIKKIAVLIAVFCISCLYHALTYDDYSVTTAVKNPTQQTIENANTDTNKKEYVDYYFRNSSLKKSHYEKHGIEMGFDNADDYEYAASAVINNESALFKTEKEDGDYIYYIEATNEFVVLSTDGYIRTYFLPSRGKAYFEKQ